MLAYYYLNHYICKTKIWYACILLNLIIQNPKKNKSYGSC